MSSLFDDVSAACSTEALSERVELTLTTFNVLNPIFARINEEGTRESTDDELWLRRNEAIVRQLCATGSDVLCLQEYWVGGPGSFHALYEKELCVRRGYKAVLSSREGRSDGCLTLLGPRVSIVGEPIVVHFGSFADRVAHILQVRVAMPPRDDAEPLALDGCPTPELLLVNTHLSYPHAPFFSALRLDEVRRLMHALDAVRAQRRLAPCFPAVLCGDFNGSPTGNVFKAMLAHGFVSAVDQHRGCSKYAKAQGPLASRRALWLAELASARLGLGCADAASAAAAASELEVAERVADALLLNGAAAAAAAPPPPPRWITHRTHTGRCSGVDYVWLTAPMAPGARTALQPLQQQCVAEVVDELGALLGAAEAVEAAADASAPPATVSLEAFLDGVVAVIFRSDAEEWAPRLRVRTAEQAARERAAYQRALREGAAELLGLQPHMLLRAPLPEQPAAEASAAAGGGGGGGGGAGGGGVAGSAPGAGGAGGGGAYRVRYREYLQAYAQKAAQLAPPALAGPRESWAFEASKSALHPEALMDGEWPSDWRLSDHGILSCTLVGTRLDAWQQAGAAGLAAAGAVVSEPAADEPAALAVHHAPAAMQVPLCRAVGLLHGRRGCGADTTQPGGVARQRGPGPPRSSSLAGAGAGAGASAGASGGAVAGTSDGVGGGGAAERVRAGSGGGGGGERRGEGGAADGGGGPAHGGPALGLARAAQAPRPERQSAPRASDRLKRTLAPVASALGAAVGGEGRPLWAGGRRPAAAARPAARTAVARARRARRGAALLMLGPDEAPAGAGADDLDDPARPQSVRPLEPLYAGEEGSDEWDPDADGWTDLTAQEARQEGGRRGGLVAAQQAEWDSGVRVSASSLTHKPMPEAAMTDTLKPPPQQPSVFTRRPLWQQAFTMPLPAEAAGSSRLDGGAPDTVHYVCSDDACEPLSDALARLIALDEGEVAALEAQPELEVQFSEEERRLYEKALAALDYFGDWADPAQTKDSIVLACEAPSVVGGEFTCADGAFKPERKALHAKIIAHMLPAQPPKFGAPLGGDGLAGSGASSHKRAYIVVGVPGSGKDSVLKRYLRRANAGVDVVDASADRLKGYLAQWADDELCHEVRQHCRRHGYSKQLLHAQYLHRESIYVVQRLVEQTISRGLPFMLEKTLYWLPQIVDTVSELRAAGYEVHLYGTLISPLKNWEFLNKRAQSGQSFGRLISKEQAVQALRRYHANLELVLRDPSLGLSAGLSSVNLYDVLSGEWKLRLLVPRESSAPGAHAEPKGERDSQGALLDTEA